MKKNMYFAFAFALLVLLLAGSSQAAIDVYYQCHDHNCIEGTMVDFSVVVYNNLNRTVMVDDVYLKDNDYGDIMTFDIRETVEIVPEQAYSFNFTRTIGAPRQGYTFYYVPCFTASAYALNGSLDSIEVCGEIVKSFTVVPLSKIECYEDSDCHETEFCRGFKCKNINCNYDEKIEDHRCAKLNCLFFQSIKARKCVFETWSMFAGVLVIICIIYAIITVSKGKTRKKSGKKGKSKETSSPEDIE